MRIDKWLWAARFYKTRSASSQAIEAGHVAVNGERVKPAKLVKPGDEILVRRPPFEHTVVVKALSEKRGGAAEAALLFQESEESRSRRAMLAAQMKASPTPRFSGRPTKKTRRDYEKWLRESDET
jgi:ribosome-associated heat shock protein Hsp15